MTRKNCQNILVDGGIPEKMADSHHILFYAHDAVYRPFKVPEANGSRLVIPLPSKTPYSLIQYTHMVKKATNNFVRKLYPLYKSLTISQIINLAHWGFLDTVF